MWCSKTLFLYFREYTLLNIHYDGVESGMIYVTVTSMTREVSRQSCASGDATI